MGRARAAEAAAWRPSSEGILDAAERVFARQGYGETSLRQLMAAAEVSTTAFYARFPSKEAVLDALVAKLLGDLTERARVALAGAKSLDEGFDVGVDTLVAVLRGHRDLVRLMLTEAPCSAQSLQTTRAAYGLLAGFLGSKLERLAGRGEVRVEDPTALGWALVGAMQIQVMRWAVYRELSDAELADALRSTARALLPAVTQKKVRR
jgi:AcrR family transcriptional regulator